MPVRLRAPRIAPRRSFADVFAMGRAMGDPAGLLPLRDPAFALREAAKHLLLLEDHLVHPDRRCADCIGKHSLTAEAFADEAVQLGDRGGMGSEVAATVRGLWTAMRTGAVDAAGAAATVRALRKRLYAALPAE